MTSTGPTVKLSIEGDPALVEAVTGRIRQLFTVTYVSGDKHIQLTGHIRRYLRLLPPNLAHNSTTQESHNV